MTSAPARDRCTSRRTPAALALRCFGAACQPLVCTSGWPNSAAVHFLHLLADEIQRLNGLAAAAGDDLPKRLIVITSGGLTRPAADFADKAKVYAFRLNRATGRLTALNSLADEALLPVRAPGEGDSNPGERGPYGPCPDRSCRPGP